MDSGRPIFMQGFIGKHEGEIEVTDSSNKGTSFKLLYLEHYD